MLTSAQIRNFAAILFPPPFQPLKIGGGWGVKPQSPPVKLPTRRRRLFRNLAAVAQPTYGARRGAGGNRFLVRFGRKTRINTGFCCFKTGSAFSENKLQNLKAPETRERLGLNYRPRSGSGYFAAGNGCCCKVFGPLRGLERGQGGTCVTETCGSVTLCSRVSPSVTLSPL